MHIETLVVVTGLADDHAAVREALAAVVERELGAGAVVLEPAQPPAMGFAMVLAAPKSITPAALAQLRHALEFELHHRSEVMTAELTVKLLDETEA